jgi:hypothetical protein
MTEKLNIYQKLLEIQKSISGLGKDKKANSYSYVTGDKVLEHIKPLMNKLGLILKQEVLSIENVKIDYKTGIGTAYEKAKSEINSKVMMQFTWVDCETGDKDVNLFGANGQNDWDKGVGSALTYGERYFLLKFFHIATDEDDIDNPNLKGNEQVTKTETAPKKTLFTQKTFDAIKNAVNNGDEQKVISNLHLYEISEDFKSELSNLSEAIKKHLK